jgi:hypothetical protein
MMRLLVNVAGLTLGGLVVWWFWLANRGANSG